jgi:hypothetical protein
MVFHGMIGSPKKLLKLFPALLQLMLSSISQIDAHYTRQPLLFAHPFGIQKSRALSKLYYHSSSSE